MRRITLEEHRAKMKSMEAAPKDKARCDMTGNDIVQCLSRVYTAINEKGYVEETRASIGDDLKIVASKFGISDVAVALLAAIIEVHSCDENDLAKYLNCTRTTLMGLSKYIDELEIKGVVMGAKSHFMPTYQPTHAVRDVLISGGEFRPVPSTGLTPDEFYERLSRLANDQEECDIDEARFSALVDAMVVKNQQIMLAKGVKSCELWKKNYERRILYRLCQNFVDSGDDSLSIRVLIAMATENESRRTMNRKIANEETWLQKNGYVAFGCTNGMADSDSLALTDKAKTELLGDVEVQESSARLSHEDLVCWKKIQQKDLFFNAREREQIGRLDTLLEDKNFHDVQARLTEMGMRRGFNAIFYGGPGTGKTACVYEIARRTGRDIFSVDMSKLKSKWVGDSEKSVKGLFAIYRKLCRQSDKAPILLFNEADAIFSKRLHDVNSSVDQMMNAIQNIILQEMEEIQGILIATTNLATNLDPAFERRFIFKIEFATPDEESRTKIWKAQIPNLNEETAAKLAHGYTFSGGNIENVARKSTIDYVLSGEKPEYETLAKYCDEELLSARKTSHIGF